MDSDVTQSGQFRGLIMDELLKWANSPLWDKEPSKNKYQVPLLIGATKAGEEGLKLAKGIPQDEIYELGNFVCAKSPQSHIGPYLHAIDFLVPDGTPVVAANGGRVIEIQEHSNSWGPTPEYRDKLNYLTIDHYNGEFSQYCHLTKDSVSQNGIAVGTLVDKGQQIAVVGKTGWTDRDHLHFIVFRGSDYKNPFGFKSLYIQFD